MLIFPYPSIHLFTCIILNIINPPLAAGSTGVCVMPTVPSFKTRSVSFQFQVKFIHPFLLSHFLDLAPSVSETDGRGMCLCMFRGQARPTQQGSSSHQWLTSTSSSGHVQRQNPALLSFLLNWHTVSDMTTAHRPQFSLESTRFYAMVALFTCHCECLCLVVNWRDFCDYYFHYLSWSFGLFSFKMNGKYLSWFMMFWNCLFLIIKYLLLDDMKLEKASKYAYKMLQMFGTFTWLIT